ncbi:MAG: efflux RND transporter periplasmic adaptor subunit, partial [Magnetococcales bacterium]|nr:efflux RND transporter periplasmic adaptor subunit [Magnetococcales bacterium]
MRAGFLEITGITKAQKDVALSMPVTGRIKKIHYREGSRVKAGDIILSLENRLESLEVEHRHILLKDLSELHGAKEREKKLKDRLEATKRLYKQTRSVSGDELAKKELEYLAAVVDRKRLQIVEEREGVEYRIARENLERRILRAPFEGTITKLLFDEGESVGANQPVVQLVDTANSIFVTNIEERIGRQFHEGQTIILNIKVGDDKISREGTIMFISPIVDPASGLMEVYAIFENA